MATWTGEGNRDRGGVEYRERGGEQGEEGVEGSKTNLSARCEGECQTEIILHTTCDRNARVRAGTDL